MRGIQSASNSIVVRTKIDLGRFWSEQRAIGAGGGCSTCATDQVGSERLNSGSGSPPELRQPLRSSWITSATSGWCASVVPRAAANGARMCIASARRTTTTFGTPVVAQVLSSSSARSCHTVSKRPSVRSRTIPVPVSRATAWVAKHGLPAASFPSMTVVPMNQSNRMTVCARRGLALARATAPTSMLITGSGGAGILGMTSRDIVVMPSASGVATHGRSWSSCRANPGFLAVSTHVPIRHSMAVVARRSLARSCGGMGK